MPLFHLANGGRFEIGCAYPVRDLWDPYYTKSLGNDHGLLSQAPSKPLAVDSSQNAPKDRTFQTLAAHHLLLTEVFSRKCEDECPFD